MGARFIVNFDFRIKNSDIQLSQIIEHFTFIIVQINNLSQVKKDWYETGHSRKQALNEVAFQNGNITDNTRLKWERRYKKNIPMFVDGVWDANDDEHSCGISYRKMFYDERNRASVEVSLVVNNEENLFSRFISFVSQLALSFDCSYMSIDSNGYNLLERNVFPERLAVGWMLYIPHILLTELIPEAARVVPVMDGEKQKGTIIVSTEEIFDGNNKEHIGKANDIEIKLLDLGLLPLMTEL
ncbi:immunity 52 family protein [Leclercia adecarboxylata]|uniref:Imm52 family immunity protein n=1 Tax=Leclercia adecarboxylata TaxID=83655 RepID=UPI00202A6C68|nr:Imm52 family immunity protein [Leclercia adecarboxylata]URN97480.1 immunity 52 family protein [Leclercia adecarboxylata]